jgi:hypothetical protein
LPLNSGTLNIGHTIRVADAQWSVASLSPDNRPTHAVLEANVFTHGYTLVDLGSLLQFGGFADHSSYGGSD